MKKPDALSRPGSLVEILALVLFSAIACVTPLHGAETPAATGGGGYTLVKGTNEFGLWAGGSPDSSGLIGSTDDRKLLLFALRYGRIVAAWESLSLEYTLDVFPAAVVFEPDRVRRGSSTIMELVFLL